MDIYSPVIKGPTTSDNSFTGTGFIKTGSSDSYFLLGAGGHALLSSKEPDLGNPGISGYVLSSTTAGVRSWVPQSGGGGGTVTSVSSGNGMNFTAFTTSGTITLGTPSTITGSTTNSITATSHTHAWSNTPGYTTNTGTVTSVIAGTGMTQTGTSTINPTLNVIGGNGIISNADNIALTTLSSAWNAGSTYAITAADFIGSSDKRLKENIQLLPSRKINSIYKSFNFKTNTQPRIGVIAQELEIEYPEFVRTDEDGMKSVSYSDLHSAEIAYLKERVEYLESTIISLLNR